MAAPVLATKFYIPPPPPIVVTRSRLLEKLNEGLLTGCAITLVSAPTGLGKTTLNCIEKAETEAIGTALAMGGYGALQAPEFDEHDTLADAPVEKAKDPN